MAIKIDSEASCRAAYIDYYTNENTKVSAEDMRRIVQRYDDATRRSWQVAFTKASNDENRYEFDDDQFEDIRLESYEETEDEYGEDVNVKAEKARNVGDGVGVGIAGLGALLGRLGGAGGKAIKALSKLSKFGLDKLPGIGTAISCIAAFVVGLSYKLNKANKEEAKAVEELAGEMQTQQELIVEQEKKLVDVDKEIHKASDNATKENDDANQDIENLAGDHEFHSKIYLNYKAKEDRGEILSQSERMEYEYRAKMMGSTSDIIETRCKAADETLQENKDAISGFESDFDDISTNLADVQGVTDYAASIDEATQKSCKTQAILHGINVISGTSSALKAFGNIGKSAVTGPVGWVISAVWAAIGALGAAGALFSGKAVKEQTEFANKAGEEIALRVETQDANANTTENLDEGIDNYNTTDATIRTNEVIKPNNLTIADTPRVNPFLVNNNDDDSDDGKSKPRYLT